MALETNKVPVTIRMERRMARVEAKFDLPPVETMIPACFL